MTRLSPRVLKALQIAALIVVTIALIVVGRSINWIRAGEALRHAHGEWLSAAIMANTAILMCWAGFWGAIRPPRERHASYSRMLEVSATASALMNTLPFGGGHASSVALLMRRAGLTQRGALSVMAVDQLGEGLVKVVIFIAVGLSVAIPVWMKASVTTVSALVAIWFVTLAVISRWAEELSVFRDWRHAARGAVWIAAMKSVQLLAVIAVQLAYDVHLGVGDSLLVFASILFGSMLPIAPGNLGTFEAAAFLAYRHLGVAPESALSLAIMQHVCFLIPAVGAGYLVLSGRTLSRSAMASR